MTIIKLGLLAINGKGFFSCPSCSSCKLTFRLSLFLYYFLPPGGSRAFYSVFTVVKHKCNFYPVFFCTFTICLLFGQRSNLNIDKWNSSAHCSWLGRSYCCNSCNSDAVDFGVKCLLGDLNAMWSVLCSVEKGGFLYFLSMYLNVLCPVWKTGTWVLCSSSHTQKCVTRTSVHAFQTHHLPSSVDIWF